MIEDNGDCYNPASAAYMGRAHEEAEAGDELAARHEGLDRLTAERDDLRRQRDELRAALALMHAKTVAVLHTAALPGVGSDASTLARALAACGQLALDALNR